MRYKNLEKKVFATHEMAVVLNYKGSVKNLNIWIKRLKDRGLIKQVKKGYYALANEEINKFEYSNILYTPSYISLDSALNYYGIIPQVPLSVTAITLKRAKSVDHEGVAYEYFHISSKYYWGYENIGNVLIADREKSLVDKVYFESFKSDLQTNFMDELTLEDVSKEKLLGYASKIQNKAFNNLMEALYVKF
ncbi:MAG: hypothetical protein WC988_04485 [Patescibacteria group bacterium]